MLGISAGVMISLSFIELLPTSAEEMGYLLAFLLFFGALLAYYVINHLTQKREGTMTSDESTLYQIGLVSMVVILIHNIPEGIITLTGTLVNQNYGLMLAIAIIVHNIPEGVAISVSIYKSTPKKRITLRYGFIASIAEPFGGLLALFFLNNIASDIVIYSSLAIVSGIMVGLSIVDILPASIEFDSFIRHLPGL